MNDTTTKRPWERPEVRQLAGAEEQRARRAIDTQSNGCPRGDPDCLQDEGDCHDACEAPIFYEGNRRDMGASVTWYRWGETRVHSLPPRLDLVNHSPDGFEWGYSGSGPAQLAFALALHVLGDEARARAVYQRLKERIIAPLQTTVWTMTDGAILHAIEEIEAEAGR